MLTPEDTVIEAFKGLTYEVTTNSKNTKFEQMELLKQLAKMFQKIVEKNAQEVADKQMKNGGIINYNKDPQPRVAVPQPRVEITTP